MNQLAPADQPDRIPPRICALPYGLEYPGDPEGEREVKGWLGQHMGHSYGETVDQKQLARHFDLSLARATRSFAKFHREVLRLLKHVASG